MIEVKHLSKKFDGKLAVDDVSFTVERGEVVGFLGPNGAGKSTTMRIITGFLSPSSGTVVIGGDDIQKSSLAARQKIGYLPESAPTYKEMTVTGFLGFIAKIRGYTGKTKTIRIDRVIEKCFLEDVQYQTIDTLSKGYNQRVCLAQCLLHDPEYLIMDEPTDGLDPNQKYEVRAMIREMAKEKTILLSTHNLDETEAICSRIIIISKGQILADDTPANLKIRSAMHGAVRFTTNQSNKVAVLSDLTGLSSVTSVKVLNESDSNISVRAYPIDPAISPAEEILRYFKTKGWPVQNMIAEEGQLEDVFRSITLDTRYREGSMSN